MTIFPSIMLWAAIALGHSSLPGGLNQYTATANPGETFTYDADGNLTQDAKFDYTWDAENRLASVTARNPAAGSKKLVLTYDAVGRRIRKQAYTWSTGGIGGPPGWSSTPTLDRKFVYDRWNLLEELNALAGDVVVERYTWGLDLSGQAGNPSTSGMHAASGVGGILSMYDAAGAKSHLYYFNGNGDVGQLMDVSNCSTSARYEMYPYGGELVATGSAATVNPFRFSSKYWDGEQQAYYYGYRYLKPKMGRWLNRDPINEAGGLNLYVMVANAPSNGIDPLGLCDDSDDCGIEFLASWDYWSSLFASCPGDDLASKDPAPSTPHCDELVKKVQIAGGTLIGAGTVAGASAAAIACPPAGVAMFGTGIALSVESPWSDTVPEILLGTTCDLTGVGGIYSACTNRDLATQRPLGLSPFETGFCLGSVAGQIGLTAYGGKCLVDRCLSAVPACRPPECDPLSMARCASEPAQLRAAAGEAIVGENMLGSGVLPEDAMPTMTIRDCNGRIL